MTQFKGKIWSVREYRRGHSILLVEISDQQSKAEDESSFTYVVFEDLIYFEGPLGWKTLDIVKNETSSKKHLFEKLGKKNQFEESVHQLFSILTELEPVHIIARRMLEFDRLPEMFRC